MIKDYSFELLNKNNVKQILRLRNQKKVREASFKTKVIREKEHLEWFNKKINEPFFNHYVLTHNNQITFPPPPPKVQAIAKQAPKTIEKTAEEIKADELNAFKKNTLQQTILLCIGGLFMFVIGNYAPSEFMQHMIVFALACFVGFQVIWNVSHALHTPLMAVTNAISGIIIIGAVLQMTSESWIAIFLAAISVLISTINIVGGFLVTRRMLAMFQKS